MKRGRAVARRGDAASVRANWSRVYQKLEAHYRDMQDLEFTVERGTLYMLQTRNGKRTAKAALKIAVDMASEKLITQDEAVLRVDPAALDQLLHPTIARGLQARHHLQRLAGVARRRGRRRRVRSG